MLFIFYLIRKCNRISRRWSGCVCVCACACGCVCVRVRIIQQDDVWRWSDGGWEESILSLVPSSLCLVSCLRDRVWIRMYRKANPMIVFFFLKLERYLSAAWQPNTQQKKPPPDQQFYKLDNMPESTWFRNLFDPQLCRSQDLTEVTL